MMLQNWVFPGRVMLSTTEPVLLGGSDFGDKFEAYDENSVTHPGPAQWVRVSDWEVSLTPGTGEMVMSNKNTVVFTVPAGGWAEVPSFAAVAESYGGPVWYTPITIEGAADPGTVVIFEPGDLSVTIPA